MGHARRYRWSVREMIEVPVFEGDYLRRADLFVTSSDYEGLLGSFVKVAEERDRLERENAELRGENARLLGLLPIFKSADPAEQEMARHLTALYEWVITHRPGHGDITTPPEPR